MEQCQDKNYNQQAGFVSFIFNFFHLRLLESAGHAGRL
jgi:hypothetical protein